MLVGREVFDSIVPGSKFSDVHVCGLHCLWQELEVAQAAETETLLLVELPDEEGFALNVEDFH